MFGIKFVRRVEKKIGLRILSEKNEPLLNKNKATVTCYNYPSKPRPEFFKTKKSILKFIYFGYKRFLFLFFNII